MMPWEDVAKRGIRVAQVLRAIFTLPRRKIASVGDMAGDYDFWFDGGAGRIITGVTRYEFTDGVVALEGVIPRINMSIEFPDGQRVDIEQATSIAKTVQTPCGPAGVTDTVIFD
jgi:hypothetical protein